VQVDPTKPTLNAPGAKRLKLKFDEALSNFALNVNLRRYNGVPVLDGYSFPHLTKRLNVAGRHITSHLVDLLTRRG